MNKIFFANWKNQPLQEVFPGIHAGQLWQGQTGAKAMIVKIEPGGKWQGIDVHETGSEEIFVISGTFHDGKRSYPSGTFIHNPIGSSHVPQSDTGCLLFVFYPN
jgi:anti-sigma factor ChrR (cupin superfamily)